MSYSEEEKVAHGECGKVTWAEFTFPPLNLDNINKTVVMQQTWFNEELLELWKQD